MFDEIISEKYTIIDKGTSEGTQVKYKKGKYWYKLDHDGREGLCEYLASKLLTFTDLKQSDYILYEQGMINGKCGCRSKDYLTPGENFVTFYRLYFNEYGKNLADVLSQMDGMEERIEYTCSFVYKLTGLDIHNYLSKIFTLDRIILNEDRHVNNLALIDNDNGFRVAPIFDNGRSLLTANVSVNWNRSMSENVKRVVAKPFSGSHEAMFKYFGEGFNLDYMNAIRWLESEEESQERNVLLYKIKELYENND